MANTTFTGPVISQNGFQGAVTSTAVTATTVTTTALTATGTVTLTLPTSDPGVAGQLYSDSGTVKISAGA